MGNPEEVLAAYGRARLHEEAVNVERVYFYKTDRRVNPRQEEPFLVLPGKLPILVTAPHAVRYCRQRKIKPSDQFTGSIVCLLNQLTDCQGIAATKLYGGDPDTDFLCIFKEQISEICARNKVKFVLDLQGAPGDLDFDLILESDQGKTLFTKASILESLTHQFNRFGLNRINHDRSAASNPNSILQFAARELGIPALTIRINKHFRVPGQNPQGFHRLLGALTEGMKELG